MTLKLLIKCYSIQETKAFYTGILGFNVSDSAQETCTVEKNGGTLLFTEKNLWHQPPKCTGTIYFFLPDVDSYYESVKESAIIRWPPEDMPYGTREFGLKDCNDYTLAFANGI